MTTAADKLLDLCDANFKVYVAKVEAPHEAEQNEETEDARRTARQALITAGMSLAKARTQFLRTAEADLAHAPAGNRGLAQ